MLTVLAVCVVGGLGTEGSVKGVIMLVKPAHWLRQQFQELLGFGRSQQGQKQAVIKGKELETTGIQTITTVCPSPFLTLLCPFAKKTTLVKLLNFFF